MSVKDLLEWFIGKKEKFPDFTANLNKLIADDDLTSTAANVLEKKIKDGSPEVRSWLSKLKSVDKSLSTDFKEFKDRFDEVLKFFKLKRASAETLGTLTEEEKIEIDSLISELEKIRDFLGLKTGDIVLSMHHDIKAIGV